MGNYRFWRRKNIMAISKDICDEVDDYVNKWLFPEGTSKEEKWATYDNIIERFTELQAHLDDRALSDPPRRSEDGVIVNMKTEDCINLIKQDVFARKDVWQHRWDRHAPYWENIGRKHAWYSWKELRNYAIDDEKEKNNHGRGFKRLWRRKVDGGIQRGIYYGWLMEYVIVCLEKEDGTLEISYYDDDDITEDNHIKDGAVPIAGN